MPIHVKKSAVAAAFTLVEIGASSRRAAPAQAIQVEIPAQQDATLLGGLDAETNNSLADPGIFVGTDGDGNPKRGLIEFNIAAAVPAGATITSAQLQLTVGQVAGAGGDGPGENTGPETISLYDESQAWGQPTNFPGATTFGGTGHGAAPDPGDATWNYAFFNSTPWTTPGGDWSSSLTDIADTSVTGTLASFTWTSSAMVTNVQNWLNNPSANFGWILKNADETDIRTFRAFWSAQGAVANDDPALAPQLSVTYILSSPPTAYWSGAEGSIWSTEIGSPSPATNWSATDGGPDLHQIPGPSTNVIFGAAGNSAGTLTTTLGADFTISSLTFTSARTNPVIIGGANTLTLSSGGITVQSGSGAHTIDTTGDATAATPGILLASNQTWTNNSSNPLTIQSSIGDAHAGYSLTFAGTGVIQLAGDSTYSGGTIVTSGRLFIEPTTSSTSALASGPLSITGGTVQLAQNVTAGTALGTSNVVLPSLSITGNGTFDIANNHIIINYAAGPDPIASIASWIANGAYGSGTTATWTGTGITSTAAAANSGSYGIGYADAADPGNPANLSSGQIEIMYTLLGDANLDGKVNGTDFNLMATNFNQVVTAGWDKGDFNYDGKVNGNDFVLLAANFNQFASQSAVSPADLAALDSFAAQNGIPLTNVPEPATAAIIAFAALPFLRRRHRAIGRPRSAFTVVSLLVLIAIFALLIALLIPTVERTREQANLALCKDNLRKIGSTLILYARSNDGSLPVSPTIENPHLDLLNPLAASHLTGDPKIYYCPSQLNPALSFSNQNFNSGTIGYYYYSALAAPADQSLSKFLRLGVSWPRKLNLSMDPKSWVMSDIWVSALPTAHPGYKKGVNYLMLDGSVGFVAESPRQQFH